MAELDDAVADIVEALLANSAGSLRAYKDLYREAMEAPLSAGLAFEAATEYPIDDTGPRLADFR